MEIRYHSSKVGSRTHRQRAYSKNSGVVHMGSPDTGFRRVAKPDKPAESGNVVQRLTALIFRSSDPERVKRRQLKQIAKTLKKKRVRFYKQRGDMVEPGMARFFYQLYRVLGPARAILSRSDMSETMGTILVESFLSEEELALREPLSEEAVRESTAKGDSQKVLEKLKQDLRDFVGVFDTVKSHEINEAYRLLATLLGSINFDFYYLLKKFDSTIPENDFVYKPAFTQISGSYVSEQLKDFLDVVNPLDTEADWSRILDVLKDYRGLDVVNGDGWKRALQLIKEVKRSEVLELVVKLIDADPSYAPAAGETSQDIVDRYLTKIKRETELSIQKIGQEKRAARVEHLSKLVFGTSAISRVANYSERLSTQLLKKKAGGFVHITALNYLKAYLLDYLKKDIRDVVDLLLIKGKWATGQVSQQLSEAYHQLLNTSTEIVQFDEALADDGDVGRKVKALLLRAGRDKNSTSQLAQLVRKANDTAKGFIVKSAQNLITLGKTLKLALEDYTRTDHELVINWHEIESDIDSDIKQLIVDAYKQIYHFLELLKLHQ